MTNPPDLPQSPRVAVIGGGLAGMAAAAAAVEHGCSVELFEARRRLGGRAGSFWDRPSGQWIDHGQHVSMGCCTNLADFCRRTGIADCFRRDRQFVFIGPDGRHYPLAASGWLPAPLHLLPGLLRLGYLSLGQRCRILRSMSRLVRLEPGNDADGRTVQSWLREQGESDRAIRRFWEVVLVSTLAETLDRASLTAAQKVFADGFLASRQAHELEIPRVPLGEIFDRRLGAWLTGRGVAVHLSTPVKTLEGDARQAEALVLPDGSRRPFDFFVVAVPWHRVRGLFAEPLAGALPFLDHVEQIPSSPITAVHLWFDRPIIALHHAALVDRLSQWVFRPDGPGHYCQVVISGSRDAKNRDRQEVIDQVRGELADAWPEAGRAELLRGRVVTEPAAVFSVRPGLDRLRLAQQTPVANLMLAGDWTATGWPATMEGAVRSGHLAVEAILRASGRQQPLLVPDLPRSRLAKWLCR